MRKIIDLCSNFFNKDLLLDNTSLGEQIEKNTCCYNFNRKVDILCLKNALNRFLRTGLKEDAFDVYFCFSEIFNIFGGYKKGINMLLELLSNFEAFSGSLLMKHRDHYSHSVYVFAIGIAIFDNSDKLKKILKEKYGEKYNDIFLKMWGFASLFHDVGYPYELSFMQVKDYGDRVFGHENSSPIVKYSNVDSFININEEEYEKIKPYLIKGNNINSLFASFLYKDFGGIYKNVDSNIKEYEEFIGNRIINASKYMDHAYFSAVLLLKKYLISNNEVEQYFIDAIKAILYHNNLCKYDFKKKYPSLYKQISVEDNWLCYLLMLCDELQCFDRVGYGLLSKNSTLAWDMDLEFKNNSFAINYYFNDTITKNNVLEDINENVVNTSELGIFNIEYLQKAKNKKVSNYISDTNYVNIIKMAEAINICYNEDCQSAGIHDYMREQFDNLTLEYKLSNIGQAKNYIKHIEKINCFFSDKKLDYPKANNLTDDEIEYLAIYEHIRWVREKSEMGWKYGTDYENRSERERKRISKDIIPYSDLSYDEQKKDLFPIRNMIKILKENCGIEVYRLNNESNQKYIVGVIGHRDLSRIKKFDEEAVRYKVRNYFRELKEKYNIIVYSGFAEGADLLFVEEALKCDIDVIAVLPCRWEEFTHEHKDNGELMCKLLGQTVSVLVKPNNVNRYSDVSKYIVKKCDEMLALWDQIELPLVDENGNNINEGGTYATIKLAREYNKKLTYF